MSHRKTLLLAAVVLYPLPAGCGGGSGQSGGNRSRPLLIATTRVTRAQVAMAGLAVRINRSHSPAMGHRAAVLLRALQRKRDVEQGQDEDTGLYYALNVQEDGSGSQNLFLDSGDSSPAGSFTWGVPLWNSGQPGTYPATIQAQYRITAGEFAGDHGEADVTPDDPDGNSGHIHLILIDAQKDSSTADFTFSRGAITGTIACTLADGTSYNCQESTPTSGSGDMVFQINFPDGGTETIDLNPDGTASETYTDAQGNTDGTGEVTSSGDDTITYPDGSDETVNVDTAPEDDSGGDASSESLRRHSGIWAVRRSGVRH